MPTQTVPTARSRSPLAVDDATRDVVDRLMTLWARLPADDAAARAAFAAVYAERVVLNGTEVSLKDLLRQSRALQAAFTGIGHEVHECLRVGDTLVVAFELSGRHTGPWATPLGTVEATGRPFTVAAMDVLTFAEDRIVRITAVNDQLGLLHQLGALRLAG